jgi:hypothetical protein
MKNEKSYDYMRTHKKLKNLKVPVRKKKGSVFNPKTGKYEQVGEEATTTASIPSPADTAMGPRFVHDRRRKKERSVMLKRFRDYLENKGIN